jgi:hypothetical protein
MRDLIRRLGKTLIISFCLLVVLVVLFVGGFFVFNYEVWRQMPDSMVFVDGKESSNSAVYVSPSGDYLVIQKDNAIELIGNQSVMLSNPNKMGHLAQNKRAWTLSVFAFVPRDFRCCGEFEGGHFEKSPGRSIVTENWIQMLFYYPKFHSTIICLDVSKE